MATWAWLSMKRSEASSLSRVLSKVTLAVGSQASSCMVGVQMSALGPHGRRLAVATRGLVCQHQQEEILMWHLLRPGQGEPLGQSVEHGPELEATERGPQVGRDHVGVASGHRFSPELLVDTAVGGKGSAYWLGERR
jgi:hypothetical protein